MKANRYPHVFQPLTIRGLTLKNRIEYSPTVALKCNADGSVGEDMINFSGFMYHSAGQIKNCIALSRAHRLANRKMVRIRELKNETFLSMAEDETPQLTELLHRACQEASFDPILQAAESYQELINIITKGLGIYLLNTEHYMYDRPELHYVGIEDLPDTTVRFAWNPVNNNEIIPIMLRTIRSITE